jgi:GNAT superfamily N-acetyltransferase
MDPLRQKLFIQALIEAERKYFGPEWGRKRLELASLVTDPRYHRLGAGKALTQWGLEKATECHVPITLTASPLGKRLYTHLGFQELGCVDCEVQGDKEKAWTYAMIWVPEGWEKPSIPLS